MFGSNLLFFFHCEDALKRKTIYKYIILNDDYLYNYICYVRTILMPLYMVTYSTIFWENFISNWKRNENNVLMYRD